MNHEYKHTLDDRCDDDGGDGAWKTTQAMMSVVDAFWLINTVCGMFKREFKFNLLFNELCPKALTRWSILLKV